MSLWRLRLYLQGNPFRVLCWLGWHGVIYADHSLADHPEPGVFLGKIRRYCGRCDQSWLADYPEMWDRIKAGDPAFGAPVVHYYDANGRHLQTADYAGAGIP